MPISSELSDKDILAITSMEKQAATGRFRFMAKLPSGRDLSSEWIPESSKTQGMIKWCEAVNLEIKSDKEEAAARARRQALESRAQNGARIVGADSKPITPSSPTIGTTPATTSAGAVGPSSSSDPIAFAKQVLKELEQSEKDLLGQYNAALSALTKVRQDLVSWRQIVHSFTSSPSPPEQAPTSTGLTD